MKNNEHCNTLRRLSEVAVGFDEFSGTYCFIGNDFVNVFVIVTYDFETV